MMHGYKVSSILEEWSSRGKAELFIFILVWRLLHDSPLPPFPIPYVTAATSSV